MTEAEFQDYWQNIHAVRFAVKIPQIARYRLALRVPCSIDTAPIWSGCAEIWLRNDAVDVAIACLKAVFMILLVLQVMGLGVTPGPAAQQPSTLTCELLLATVEAPVAVAVQRPAVAHVDDTGVLADAHEERGGQRAAAQAALAEPALVCHRHLVGHAPGF